MKKQIEAQIKALLVNHMTEKKSTLDLMISCSLGLISGMSVRQRTMALHLNDTTETDSVIRKIQRFFAERTISFYDLSRAIFNALNPGKKVTIVIDRTNWDFGSKHINVLVAAMIVGNSAIPLVWETFSKKGNSNTAERKRLIKRLLDVIGKENIEVILADREFIGSEWLLFLYELGLPFAIRIKKNFFVEHEGKTQNALFLFYGVKRGKTLRKHVIINGMQLIAEATRSSQGELVIVIGTHTDTGLLSTYRTRWLIELFFKSCKSSGFYFEETHMTDPRRIDLLMGLIAIATTIVVKIGIRRIFYQKIPVKNHGRRLYSTFTYGLQLIQESLIREPIGALLQVMIDALNFLTQPLQLPFEIGQKNVVY